MSDPRIAYFPTPASDKEKLKHAGSQTCRWHIAAHVRILPTQVECRAPSRPLPMPPGKIVFVQKSPPDLGRPDGAGIIAREPSWSCRVLSPAKPRLRVLAPGAPNSNRLWGRGRSTEEGKVLACCKAEYFCQWPRLRLPTFRRSFDLPNVSEVW